MKLVELDPRTLKPNPENYRGHPQEQIAEIATSLRDLGQFKNVVVRPDGTILAGHGVVQAAIAAGIVARSSGMTARSSSSPSASPTKAWLNWRGSGRHCG